MTAQWMPAIGGIVAFFCFVRLLAAASPFDEQIIRKSPMNPHITLSYKRVPSGVCATTSQRQKQYTGHVMLPPSTLHPIQQNYSINTFFWFVEARDNPRSAPLTIYLSGGPGISSMQGFFQETGPCEVVELSDTKLGTVPREWGWDRASNMLYIDQPVQSGFSHDTVTEASLDFLTSAFVSPPAALPADRSAETFRNGTFNSNDGAKTTKTTATSASAIWHMLQVFFAEFPLYKGCGDSTEVNIFTESYGGKYGPAFAAHFHKQNEQRRNGKIPKSKSVEINVKTLGIMQGCMDDLVQTPYYSLFAYNNTYGLRVLSLEDVEVYQDKFRRPGGCRDKTDACRAAVRSQDPANMGDVPAVNAACLEATIVCNGEVIEVFPKTGRSAYDIGQSFLNPLPPSTYLEYLNQPVVQQGIGSRINFTESSSAVLNTFVSAGDYARGEYISDLASLLDSGVRVALMYGDRDYVCNWFGGEAASFSIAATSKSPSSYISNFNSAGYAPVKLRNNRIGGVVRQFGNLSFSRIYDAGHFIPFYQPETVFSLFSRIIEGRNPSTGSPIPDLSRFRTQGDANSTATNSLPEPAKPTCYLRKAPQTCSTDQIEKIKTGNGRFRNGIWYEN